METILQGLPTSWADPNVLIGSEGADDAGVYRIGPDRALVLTVDVITPIVDDPRTFGRIAVANAVSDIFAMGARPLASLSVACFDPQLPAQVYREILAGAAETAQEARCPIVGGHTIKDQEIKFGLAVVGEVHPDRLLTKRGAQVGDALVLSGPIGTAALATALKKGALREDSDAYRALIGVMTQLNAEAAQVAIDHDAHALTDITGFGLTGHGAEVADGSKVTLEIEFQRVPALPEALDQLRGGFRCGGGVSNAERAEGRVEWTVDLPEAERELLHDPQTSGPLLMALPRDRGADAVVSLQAAGYPRAAEIGRVVSRGRTALRVR